MNKGERVIVVHSDIYGDLKDIVKSNQLKKIQFSDGTFSIDVLTASIILKIFEEINNSKTRAKLTELIRSYAGVQLAITLARKQFGENQ